MCRTHKPKIMKTISMLMLLGFIVLISCNVQSKEEQARDKMEQAFEEAEEATTDYLDAEQEKYLLDLNSRIENLEHNIDRILTRSGHYSSVQRIQKRVDSLKQQRSQLLTTMEELKASCCEEWDALRIRIDSLVSNLKTDGQSIEMIMDEEEN